MSKYRELPKLKKGEGKLYSVRLNLGDNYETLRYAEKNLDYEL